MKLVILTYDMRRCNSTRRLAHQLYPESEIKVMCASERIRGLHNPIVIDDADDVLQIIYAENQILAIAMTQEEN